MKKTLSNQNLFIRLFTLAMVALLAMAPGMASAAELDEFGFIIGNEAADPNLPMNYFDNEPDPPYALRVDLTAQRVTAYEKDENGQYIKPVRTMICSTGLPETPTPTSLTKSSKAGEWYYFKEFDVWAQYATRINGGIIIHSVLYTEQDESTLQTGSVKKLGKPASHGCIRLSVEDAKWVYDNCGDGATVHVVEKDPYRPVETSSKNSSSSSTKSSTSSSSDKSSSSSSASTTKSSSSSSTSTTKSSSSSSTSSSKSSSSSSTSSSKSSSSSSTSSTKSSSASSTTASSSRSRR